MHTMDASTAEASLMRHAKDAVYMTTWTVH